MNPLAILARHYDPATELYRILVVHSVLVAEKSLQIARQYLCRYPQAAIDMEFLTEAAILHDIGIQRCHSPKIFCEGKELYVCHGFIGRGILEEEGLPRHGLACERHTGAGITREEVLREGLPMPERDYLPSSLEEKILCVADKFFSKTPHKLWREKPLAKIEKSLGKYGPDVLARWARLRAEILGE
jgi:uncharacterized protein